MPAQVASSRLTGIKRFFFPGNAGSRGDLFRPRARRRGNPKSNPRGKTESYVLRNDSSAEKKGTVVLGSDEARITAALIRKG